MSLTSLSFFSGNFKRYKDTEFGSVLECLIQSERIAQIGVNEPNTQEISGGSIPNNILKVDPVELAQQLTLMEVKLFNKLRRSHFLHFTGNDQEKKSALLDVIGK